MNPEQQQDYSFLTQNNGPKRMSFGSPNSQKQRIMLVGVIAGIVILLLVVGMILINIFSVDNTKKLTDLAAYQTEASRIMSLGAESAKDSSLRVAAQTASSTFSTHTQKTIAIASKKSIKINDKQLQSLKSSATDKNLESAKIANNYDEVFKKAYQEIINAYLSKLRTLRLEETDKTINSALIEYIEEANELSKSLQ